MAIILLSLDSTLVQLQAIFVWQLLEADVEDLLSPLLEFIQIFIPPWW